MTLNQFISKYKGKTKGYPSSKYYYGECLSIVKWYIKEVFGINPPPSGVNAAYGYWTNFPSPLPTKFTKIAYKSGRKPKAGDIIIWGTGVGKSGHIAIVYNNITTSSFNSFDQNWGGQAAHIQKHNYNGVLGWLRPKGSIMKIALYRQKDNPTVYAYCQTLSGWWYRFPLTNPKEVSALGLTWNDVRVRDTLPAFRNKPETIVKEIIKEVPKEVIKEVPVIQEKIIQVDICEGKDLGWQEYLAMSIRKLIGLK